MLNVINQPIIILKYTMNIIFNHFMLYENILQEEERILVIYVSFKVLEFLFELTVQTILFLASS